VTRARLVTAARIALMVLVLVAIVVAVSSQWSQVRAHLTSVSAGTLAVSTALGMASLGFTLLGWRALLADLGSPLHVAPASGVLFIGQLGKYLPGTVWSVVAQAEVASRLGVPRRTSAVAGVLSVAMSALAGLTVGVVALPGLLAAGGGLEYLVVLLLIPVGAVLLHPRVLNALLGRALRLVRREPLERPLSGRAIATTTVAYLLAWLALGLHFLVLVRALGGDSGALVPSVFGYALAAAVGMVVVIAPAGFGVREGVLVYLLARHLPESAPLVAALLSRFVLLACDLAAAALGWGYARSHRLLETRRAPDLSSG
jgi:hypothetical protein